MNEMVAAMRLLFSEINKRGLNRAGDVTVSKHVTLYGPWSGFQYYNIAIPNPCHPHPIQGESTCPLPEDALSSSVDLNSENLHQYPGFVFNHDKYSHLDMLNLQWPQNTIYLKSSNVDIFFNLLQAVSINLKEVWHHLFVVQEDKSLIYGTCTHVICGVHV